MGRVYYSIAATALIAVVAFAAILVYLNGRIADARRDAYAAQQSRLNQAALRMEDYLGISTQLLNVAAVVVGGETDRRKIGVDVQSLLRATDKRTISGIGAFYAAPPKFGAQAFRDPKTLDDVLAFLTPDRAYSPFVRPWYVRAMLAGGKPVFTGPYTSHEGTTFVGTSKTFEHDGRIAGVVLVEAWHSLLRSLLQESIGPFDTATVFDANGRVVVQMPERARHDSDSIVESKLRLAPWTLRIASDFPVADDVRNKTTALEIAIALLYWGAFGGVVMLLVRGRRLQARARSLSEEVVRDELTGLHNRAYILRRLDGALGAFNAGTGAKFVVLYIDLDGFALVNDSLGHSVGDELLRKIAARIADSLEIGSEFARLGGDEFVVFAANDDSGDAGRHLAESVIERLQEPFKLGDREIFISASIGIVLGGAQYGSAEELLRDADTAMYAAKRSGKSRYAVFDDAMRRAILTRLSLESDLRHAIENDEIFAKYQPVVDARTRAVVGVEALARCSNGVRELPASEFIPVAEFAGMVGDIDSAVLARACNDGKRLQEDFPGLQVSVNLSATHLSHGNADVQIAATLAGAQLDASLLKIELTETAIMERADDALAVLNRLNRIGLQIVIDDFGTGHSSLSYVQRLPVSGLKIDRSFVEPLPGSEQSAEIVRAIVALAKTLRLKVTAEGVETLEQYEALRDIGVDFIQGYYFARPLDYDTLRAYIAESLAAGAQSSRIAM